MNRNLLSVVSIASATVVICFWSNSCQNRFLVVNQGDGLVYKVDRRSGEVTALYGLEEVEVERASQDVEPEEAAVRLAREARTLDLGGIGGNEDQIRDHLRTQQGPLVIHGWKSRQVENGVYLVSFDFDLGAGVRGYFFEVNLIAEIVRGVGGDPELEQRYGLSYNRPGLRGDEEPKVGSFKKFFDLSRVIEDAQ